MRILKRLSCCKGRRYTGRNGGHEIKEGPPHGSDVKGDSGESTSRGEENSRWQIVTNYETRDNSRQLLPKLLSHSITNNENAGAPSDSDPPDSDPAAGSLEVVPAVVEVADAVVGVAHAEPVA